MGQGFGFGGQFRLPGGFSIAPGGGTGLGAAHPIGPAGDKGIHHHDRHARRGTGRHAAIGPHAQIDIAHAAARKRIGNARRHPRLLLR